jgi:hypothetical protein
VTWTAAGSWLFANSTTLTVSNQAVGNLLLVGVENDSNNTVWCTWAVRRRATWSRWASVASSTEGAHTSPCSPGRSPPPAPGTVTPSWSGTAPGSFDIAGHEFHSTAESWALDVQGNLDSAGTANWASLTPAGNGELYFGFEANGGTASGGTTSGYVYNTDAIGNGQAYRLSCPSGVATFPVWADSNGRAGIMVLVQETAAAAAPAAATARLYAPGWHPGAGLPGMPGGTPFYAPPPSGVLPAAAAAAAVPVPQRGSPVQARQQPAAAGRVTRRAGVYGGTGPPVRPAAGPVRARIPQPVRGGSVTRRAGVLGGSGPALKALAQAVAGKLRGLPQRGRSAGHGGTFAGLGPAVRALTGPVQARRLPQRGGSTASRAGTFTSLAPQAGPPVYPLGCAPPGPGARAAATRRACHPLGRGLRRYGPAGQGGGRPGPGAARAAARRKHRVPRGHVHPRHPGRRPAGLPAARPRAGPQAPPAGRARHPRRRDLQRYRTAAACR